jgi:tetratricopeptide (TPR) repeat protein
MSAALLDLPLPPLPAPWAEVVAGGKVAGFEALVDQARRQADWGPVAALQLAHTALQLGLTERGDDLVLEADRLKPSWGVVPDRWGLWPTGNQIHGDDTDGDDLPSRKRCLQLVEDYLLLRHLPAVELWKAWLHPVKDQWQQAAEPQQLALMGLVLGRRDQLPGPLEPAVEKLVGEDQVNSDPGAALGMWQQLCRRIPEWSYARLKAADLCLQRQRLQDCQDHLKAATEDQRQSPWLWDIEARLAMALEKPQEALRCWGEAIRLAGGSRDEELAELFRQRRREAEWDAEWMQPAFVAGASGDTALDRFSERLEAWASQTGVTLPQRMAGGEADPDGFAAFLDQASGRLALVG